MAWSVIGPSGAPTGVTSILGTANQITASSPTGTVTLSIPSSPVFVSPLLGTPTSGVLTNCTGTASGLTAGNVTTNANLTGPITSSGNATSIASQTGTGTTFVMSASPTFTGAPLCPTASVGDNTTKIATTAYVLAAVAAGSTGVTSVTGTANQITVSAATGAVTFSIPTNPVFSGTALTFPGTLSIVSGKTATVNKTLTFDGTDSTTMTFPATSATIARTDAAQTFTGSQTIAALVGPVTITEAVGSSGLTVTGATQVTSFPAISATQTWNAAGVTFTAFKLSVTSTASAAASLLADFQVASASVATLTKTGTWKASAGTSNDLAFGLLGSTQLGVYFPSSTYTIVSNGNLASFVSGSLTLNNLSALGWVSGTDTTGTADTFLKRGGAAATVQHGVDINGAAVAQTVKSCRGITGNDKAGAPFHITAGEGTGAATVSYIDFNTPTIAASGPTQQSLALRLTIDSAGVKCSAPLWVSNAAVTGLAGGVLAATTNASIVVYDSSGQAYRIPCII